MKKFFTHLKYEFHLSKSETAIILDRDGTLVRDAGYVNKIKDLEVFPEAIEALTNLTRLNVSFFIATNQSGIARRLYTLEDMEIFNLELLRVLEKNSILINEVYVCPHKNIGMGKFNFIHCYCRKPRAGMLKAIIKDHSFDKSKVFFVGNSNIDSVAAKRAGIKGFQLTSINSWKNITRELEYAIVSN